MSLEQNGFYNVVDSILKTVDRLLSADYGQIILNFKDNISKIGNRIIYCFEEAKKENERSYSILQFYNWNPIVLKKFDYFNLKEFEDIILHTKENSKNRGSKIDKFLYSSVLNDEYIKGFTAALKNSDLDNVYKRIINDSIYAYKNKRYSLTVATLNGIIEYIICYKAGSLEEHSTKKIIENYKAILDEQYNANVFVNYLENDVYYPCYSKREVKSNSPSRNATSHGWYNEYPSRKSALNCILIVDIILNL